MVFAIYLEEEGTWKTLRNKGRRKIRMNPRSPRPAYLSWCCDENNAGIVSNYFFHIFPFFLMRNHENWLDFPVCNMNIIYNSNVLTNLALYKSR